MWYTVCILGNILVFGDVLNFQPKTCTWMVTCWRKNVTHFIHILNRTQSTNEKTKKREINCVFFSVQRSFLCLYIVQRELALVEDITTMPNW